ncbi:redoxin domain-containing protein [Halorientalis halophila]|uniref:redoxin domain-containing protein n=1 Tax=Halorientalis halophila TaxID=3108499 RepID=UPI0030085EE0
MSLVGDCAPSFTLPGTVGDETGAIETVSLSETTDEDRAVLLLFYPFDFSPVCTTELCAIRDAEWFEFTPDLDVWAVSGDSVYAHRAFADEYGLSFPLLSDYNGEVADRYGVRYDEWDEHTDVPKRAVFLIDSDQVVRYAWHTDDALEVPDFSPVENALKEIVDTRADMTPGEPELLLEYDSSIRENR